MTQTSPLKTLRNTPVPADGYVFLRPADAVQEALRIAHTNPVWADHLNPDFVDAYLRHAAEADRIRFLNVEGDGRMFYIYCRAQGFEGLNLLSGGWPQPHEWRNTKGFLMITDICAEPEVRACISMRAMVGALRADGIATPGERAYFRRTTPGRPERIGWVPT